MEAVIYTTAGKTSGKIALPEKVFGVPWNADLVHQVIISMQSNARIGIADTKGRGEVRGGGKKPWKQKGTGRARHGSIRSPIWRGGGISKGPHAEKNFDRKVNKKMKAKALYTILSKKFRDGEVLFVDSLSLTAAKTKDAKEMLGTLAGVRGYETLSTKKRNAAWIGLAAKDTNTEKSFQNFGNIAVGEVRNLNPLEAMQYKYLVIANPTESLSFLEGKVTKK